MKHIKTFGQLFEAVSHDNDLREILEKIPGKDNIESGVMNYKTSSPSLVFEITYSDKSFWESISKKEDSKKVVKWCTDELDDMMWGEDEQEQSDSAKNIVFFKIDFNQPQLEAMHKSANRLGLKVDVGYFCMSKSGDNLSVIIRFQEDKELQHTYRGNITRKRFGQ